MSDEIDVKFPDDDDFDELEFLLEHASTVCPPDEYQLRHNRLIRHLASMVLELKEFNRKMPG